MPCSLTMSENISIHVGQAGCQIGQTLWELYLMENGIGPNGQLVDPKTEHLHHDTTFFTRNSDNCYTPRSLFVDVDPTCVDSIRDQYGRSRNPECFISGKINSSRTFAYGYYSNEDDIVKRAMEQIRRISEECNGRKIFWIFNSLNGGTGSGMGSRIIDEINTEYRGNTRKFQVAIVPDINKISPLDCINSILSLNSTIESVDMSFYFANQKIARIIQNEIPSKAIPQTYINRHISVALACLTSSSRQTPSQDINEQIGNRVFPRLHYPLISYYPTSTIQTRYKESPTVRDLTQNCFKRDSIVLDIDPSLGYYINANLFYRGDVLHSDVIRSVKLIDDSVELLEWTPAGLKLFYTEHSRFLSPERDLLRIDRSVCMLAEHTAFKEYLKGINTNFGVIFREKNLLDLYKEDGIEKEDFNTANHNIESLICEFESLI